MSALVAIPPACLGNPAGFIESILDSRLLKQLESNDEVLLTYSDLVCAPVGKVTYYQPEVLVDIQFTGLIFIPGKEVLAEVRSTSGEKVQLLVYGVFEGKATLQMNDIQLQPGQLIKCNVKELIRARNTMIFILDDIVDDSGLIKGQIDHHIFTDQLESVPTQSETQFGQETVVL